MERGCQQSQVERRPVHVGLGQARVTVRLAQVPGNSETLSSLAPLHWSHTPALLEAKIIN